MVVPYCARYNETNRPPGPVRLISPWLRRHPIWSRRSRRSGRRSLTNRIRSKGCAWGPANSLRLLAASIPRLIFRTPGSDGSLTPRDCLRIMAMDYPLAQPRQRVRKMSLDWQQWLGHLGQVMHRMPDSLPFLPPPNCQTHDESVASCAGSEAQSARAGSHPAPPGQTTGSDPLTINLVALAREPLHELVGAAQAPAEHAEERRSSLRMVENGLRERRRIKLQRFDRVECGHRVRARPIRPAEGSVGGCA